MQLHRQCPHTGACAAARTSRPPRPAFGLRQRPRSSWVDLRSSCYCSSRRRSSCVFAASTSEAASGDLPAALEKIVTTFSAVPDAKLKYQQLLYLGKKLDPMPASLHTDDNKVKGCVSQVWVHPEMKDGQVFWLADSDSMLTKGLAALLVQGLSGCSPAEVVAVKPDFIAKMGLSQALTPSRSNGFLNMLKTMQAKALQLTQESAS